MKRTVVVMLTKAPYGRVHAAEGLRAARGVVAGFDAHDVTVLFTGDGVYAARDAVNREAVSMADHVADLHEGGGRMVADGTAMDERGIAPGELAQDVEHLSGEAAANVLRDADHILDF